MNIINKPLENFASKIKGQKVAVIGVAISNTPLIEFLSKRGARVTAFDKANERELADRIETLKPYKIDYRLGPGYLSGLKRFDWVFRTPVVRPDMPEIEDERRRGATISSEMELFLDLCPSTVFGVTGSDGKTTTTTVIYEMLRQQGYKCRLGGNIGHPLIAEVESMAASDIAVVELSSFQLMSMKKSVDVAVVTNLSPNHLDVHKSYSEYIRAKKNIFTHQPPDGLCVLNYDNDDTRAMCRDVPGRLGLFGRARGGELYAMLRDENTGAVAAAVGKMPSVAAFELDGQIYCQYFGQSPQGGHAGGYIINSGDIKLPGNHNIENYLAAICGVHAYVGDHAINTVARGFGGVEHRIEHFRTLNGVNYYNDAIASSPTRTMACLNSFGSRIILIAGGKDKQLDFTPLGQAIAEKVRLLILCGQTAEKIKKSLHDYCNAMEIDCPVQVVECGDYESAVKTAWENAKAGDNVVLSPAGTSFDRFKNFEERGRIFKQLVNELPG